MKKKETTKRQPNDKLIDKRSSEIGIAVSRVLMQPGMTLPESLTAMITGFCKVIQIIAPLIGVPPEVLADDMKGAFEEYFRQGGDQRIKEMLKNGVRSPINKIN